MRRSARIITANEAARQEYLASSPLAILQPVHYLIPHHLRDIAPTKSSFVGLLISSSLVVSSVNPTTLRPPLVFPYQQEPLYFARYTFHPYHNLDAR
ncbi:hypothetical protein IAT38_007105 [Cryptococcus sp. DSM 104549]